MPKAKPVAKKSTTAPKIKVDDRVSFTVGDFEYEGTVTAVNKDNSFEVDSDDGQKFEFEAKEAKDVTVLPPAEDEPEPEADAEPEEEEKPAKKGKAKKEEPEEEEEEKPKKKGGTRSLAAAWKSAERAERGSGGLPIGNFEAIIVGGEAAETDKGISVFLTFVGVNDAEVEGKHQRKYYQLFDANGEPQEQGIGYLKADLHDIGLDDDDINDAVPECEDNDEFIEALNKLAKKIGKARPWVSIRVVAAKKTGYSNTIYIQGLMEDQDSKPELDEDNIPY